MKTVAKLLPTSFDEDVRLAYSYDCSKLQEVPKAVAWFKNLNSLRKLLLLANRQGFSITPRGFATNISGSAISQDLVLSFEKHTGVEAVNEENKWVDVKSGTRVSEVNELLSDKGLELPFYFTDNPSIGGLIARNLPSDYSLLGFALDNVLQVEAFDGTGKFYNLKKPKLVEKTGSEGCAFIITKARLRVVERTVSESQVILHYANVHNCVEKAKSLAKHQNVLSVLVLNPVTSNLLKLGQDYSVVFVMNQEGEKPWVNAYSYSLKCSSQGFNNQHHVIARNIEALLELTTQKGIASFCYMPSGFCILNYNNYKTSREEVFRIVKNSENPAATGFGIAFKSLIPLHIKRRFILLKEEFDYNNVLNRGKVIHYR